MSRIISGRYGGLYIANPKHNIRPTTGKVKEYIFNVLQNLEGHCVIDLFCGTGALGIEALSRYAEHVRFVDMNSRSIQLTKTNLQSIKAPADSWTCIKGNALNYFDRDKDLYDLILADPPYDLELPLRFFEACREHLKPGGRVILEYSSRGKVGPGSWEPARVKKMGDTTIYFFQK
jgi:16S rRNA (guanine966-N2)-methyltransferase